MSKTMLFGVVARWESPNRSGTQNVNIEQTNTARQVVLSENKKQLRDVRHELSM